MKRKLLLCVATVAGLIAVPAPAAAAYVQITPPASNVTASTDDGNVPGNVVDDDYDSRWSGFGDGAWLQLDLGSTKLVSHIKVAVYHGDERRNIFQLQVWDGDSWVEVFDGQSSGGTTGLEVYNFTDMQGSKVRYVGHGYEHLDGTFGKLWNSVTEVEIWGENGGGGGECTYPADVLNLTNWKIQLPIGNEEDPDEVKQPALDTYSVDPWFVATPACDGVQFRSAVNGVTTGGSSYPRSELREMNGSSNASWSSTSGTHTMIVDLKVTNLPEDKPHIVVGQIHDGSDDVSVFRLQGDSLYVTRGDDSTYDLIDGSYSLGERFTLKFVVSNGQIKAYYNGSLTTTISDSFSGGYFKTGAYTQANCTNSSPCSSSNYGQVIIYSVTVTHD